LKGFAKPNDKALDVCIVNNYITQKANLKPKFADWKFNQTLMKEPLKFKDSLRVVMQDIETNTDDYADKFKKVEEILEAKKDHMNLDTMYGVSLAAHAILDFVFSIKNFY